MGSIFIYLKSFRIKTYYLKTLFLNNKLALLPLFKPINKIEPINYTPANNISECLKYS